ncbi:MULTISPECIES: DUF6095 family protein [Olleya]|uniref:Uncharacterized protein n=1 Tax=Olleya namhaensis TaxID=1144750 RepID=A0A1I3T3R1_9FLAO|nr:MULTISPECIES: DUF6095 family protein [Olleya]PKG50481.1 hypothetical protein CXF54_12475 [Olleya sp. 1-3]SFJ64491.1 hypothetical protein SAMN05443431_11334 [Olleya namhaensis]
METKSTDKDILVKGVKQMGIAMLLMFVGPTLLYLVLSNKERDFYIPLLIIAILICVLAVFMAFKGINTILDSLFKSNKTK